MVINRDSSYAFTAIAGARMSLGLGSNLALELKRCCSRTKIGSLRDYRRITLSS